MQDGDTKVKFTLKILAKIFPVPKPTEKSDTDRKKNQSGFTSLNNVCQMRKFFMEKPL
jgi:hypothetical protein